MSKAKMSTRDFCLVGIFTSIIAVLAQVTVPMPYGVPMTLQTFAIPLAGVVLGAKRGTLATIVYVLLGTLGVPVFAGFTGGPGIVFGPTGGFILSFPILALMAGMGAEQGNKLKMALGLAIGPVINYICGMMMFVWVMPSDWKTAFIACVLPFIPTAIIKAVFAGVIGVRLREILRKGRVAV